MYTYSQPYPAGETEPYRPPPGNQMVMAILVTIFGFFPLGIVSIVFASKVNTQWSAGDHVGARHSAGTAKTLWIIGAAIWPGLPLLIFLTVGAFVLVGQT